MTRMSGHPGTALVQTAREVADHQTPAGALQPRDDPRDPDASTPRRVPCGQREILVRIDGEAARLHLVDAGA